MSVRTVILIVGIFVGVSAVPCHSTVPNAMRIMAVFDYDNAPLHGVYDVVVRLYVNDGDHVAVDYKETIPQVPFEHGVATLIIGQNQPAFVNELFDTPDIELSISVNQHHVAFPLTALPYAIRAQESNQARRFEDESVVYFSQEHERVGIRTKDPLVTLDVNGALRIGELQEHAQPTAGTMVWDGDANQFLGYWNDAFTPISFHLQPEQYSKWQTLDSGILSKKSVGIGMSSAGHALAVSGNVSVSGSVTVAGRGMIGTMGSSVGLDSSGAVSANRIELLVSGNAWSKDGLEFSGILVGDGATVTQLQHFSRGGFTSGHIQDKAIHGHHIASQTIQADHIQSGVIQLNDFVPGEQFVGDQFAPSQLMARHINDEAIVPDHFVNDPLSAENIKHVVFDASVFSDNSITSNHILDHSLPSLALGGVILTSQNLASESIQARHIKADAIQSNHIQNGSLDAGTLNVVLSIAQGGTNQTQFEERGMVFTTDTRYDSTQHVRIDNGQWLLGSPNVRIDNGQWLLGSPIISTAAVVVHNDKSPQLTITSRRLSTVGLHATNASATMSVTDDDAFRLTVGGHTEVVWNQYGMGIGTSNPTEALVLTGGIQFVASSNLTDDAQPGTMRRSQGGIYGKLTDRWINLTQSSSDAMRVNGAVVGAIANHANTTLINTSSQPLQSDVDGQVKLQAAGGVHIRFSDDVVLAMNDVGGSWSSISDQALKHEIASVNLSGIIQKVKALPVQKWQYKSEEGVWHIGPTAQDFRAIFQYGQSDTMIHTIDSDGVLLSAIQGVHQLQQDLRNAHAVQQDGLQDTQERMAVLQGNIQALHQRVGRINRMMQLFNRTMNEFDMDAERQDRMIRHIQWSIRMIRLDSVMHAWRGMDRLAIVFFGGVLIGMVGMIWWRRTHG